METRKQMVALALGAWISMGMAANAAPQGAPDPAQRRERIEERRERASQELVLTDAQKADLKALRERQQQQLKTLRDDTALTQEQRQERAKTIREETRSQSGQILTPDQQNKMREMRDRARDRRDENRDRRQDRRDDRREDRRQDGRQGR